MESLLKTQNELGKLRLNITAGIGEWKKTNMLVSHPMMIRLYTSVEKLRKTTDRVGNKSQIVYGGNLEN